MGRTYSGVLGAGLAVSCLVAVLGACGGGGGGSSSSGSGSNAAAAAPTYPLSLLAGHGGGYGNLDANVPTEAFFRDPQGVAVDADGNLFVTDASDHKIRKIAANGVVSTFAGNGSMGRVDGVGTAASFRQPMGIAVDAQGNLYVSEYGNCTIRKITAAGVVSTVAGSVGVCDASAFNNPRGVAVDGVGNVYVADTDNCVIKKITPLGAVVTLAGSGTPGTADGPGVSASFRYPNGIAVDWLGNVYITDSGSHRIRKITPGGWVSTIAGTGSAGNSDGNGLSASFNLPTGIAVESSGSLVVSDSGNYSIRRISPTGQVTTLAGGTWGAGDGFGPAGQFEKPLGIAVSALGDIYVADSYNTAIRKVTAAGNVTTFAGSSSAYGWADGTGSAARFGGPEGVAASANGDLYVVESSNCAVRKVTSSGVVTTVVGPGCVASGLSVPQGIAVDSAGTIYIADTGDHRVKKVTAGGAVSTLAGDGNPGAIDATGTSASFNSPRDVAVDASGNVYVADLGNCTIRKITAAGVVTTIAGSAGVCGAASLYAPYGVAVDGSGNVYVADSGNQVIRKITPAGVISLLAGSGAMGSDDGVGASASFTFPSKIALDSNGNLYVAEISLIRMVSQSGVVTTIVGTRNRWGFLGGTTPGVIRNPRGVAVSGHNLYFTMENAVGQVTGIQ